MVVNSFEFNKVSPGEIQEMGSMLGMAKIEIVLPGYETYQGRLATDAKKTTVHRIVLKPKPTTQPVAAG